MTDLSPSDLTRTIPCLADPRFLPTVTRQVVAQGADYPRVPGYRIDGRLGRGGMGVVYRAVQTALNRPVALKMLGGDHGPADDEGRLRFHKEAEALASLRHPNVVPVFEVGEADGVPYFSMELVEGGTLADRLLRQPPTPAEAAGLTAQLARGVHAAHEAGILHRDLKPSNILLSNAEGGSRNAEREIPDGPSPFRIPTSAFRVPMVADFGIAKRFGAARGDDRTMTQAGDLLGTPAYMAPEQADADSRVRVGPGADIYSLGAVLYELLTRRPPFDAGEPVRTLMQVLNDDPVPPAKLVPDVPRDLETICLKCLQKDPRKRYPTAAALADDLDRFVAGRPITARAVSAPERAWKWARRRPGVAALLGVTAVTALAAFAAVTWAWQRADDRAEEERAARRLADERGRELEVFGRQAALQVILGYIEAGLAACRTDEVGRGLVYLARAVEQAAALRPRLKDPALVARLDHLDRVARANLAAWESKLVLRTRAKWPTPMPTKHVWILDVDLSPDGTRALTASLGGLLRLFDAVTHDELFPAARFDGPVDSATFGPDGRRFLVVRRGGPVESKDAPLVARVWDTATFQPVGPEVRLGAVPAGDFLFWASGWLPDGRVALQTGPTTVHVSRDGDPAGPGCTLTADVPVTACAPTPDGTTLLTGHLDGTVRRWDLATGRETARTTAADVPAFGVVVSPTGDRVFTAHYPGRLRVYAAADLAAGPVIRTPGAIREAADPTVHGFLRTADFSPDGRSILAGGGTVNAADQMTGYLQTYAAADGAAEVAFAHRKPVWGAAYAAGGARVVSACEDRTVRVFAACDGTEEEAHQQNGNPGKVVVGRDGRTVLAGDRGGVAAALLADLGPADQPYPPVTRTLPAAIRFTPAGDRLWVAGAGLGAAAVDPRGGPAEALPVPRDKGMEYATLPAGGGHIFLWSDLGKGPQRLECWDVRAGARVAAHTPKTFTELVPLPDGGVVACPADDHPVVCYDAAGGVRWAAKLDRATRGSDSTIAGLAGGPVVVGLKGARTLTTFDAATGAAVATVSLPGRVDGLVAHPTARRVVVTYQEGYCQEFDVAAGRAVGASVAVRGAMPQVLYAPDGASLAVMHNELNRWQVERYDLATGLCLGPPLRAGSTVRRFAFHPSGRLLAVAEEAGAIRFWAVPGPLAGSAERLTAWAEMSGRMSLTGGPDEVARFLDDAEVGARRVWLRDEWDQTPPP